MNKKKPDKFNGQKPTKEPIQEPEGPDQNDKGLTIEMVLPPSEHDPKRNLP